MIKESLKTTLGFTDGMRPMQAARVEKHLNGLCRYNGELNNRPDAPDIVTNAATYIANMVAMHGMIPCEWEEDVYDRDWIPTGRKKKMYGLDGIYVEDDGHEVKLGITTSKTEHDFAQYLIDNGLTTEEAVLAKDAECQAAREAKEEAKRQVELAEEEKKQAAEAEREAAKELVHSTYVTDEERNIVRGVFAHYALEYRESALWVVGLVKNIDSPAVKAEYANDLHMDNKASRKVFEVLTGLRLPKGNKATVAFLKGITSADFKRDDQPIQARLI